MLAEYHGADAGGASSSLLRNGRQRNESEHRDSLPSQRSLWLRLAGAEIVVSTVSALVYSAHERWSFAKSLYVSVSIGMGIGLPYKDTSEVSAVYSCAQALIGEALLAVAASLLVRHVVLRQQRVLREMLDEEAASGSGVLPQLAREARARLYTKRGKRLMLLLLWLGVWALGFFTFASVDRPQGPNEQKYGHVVYALLWIVSCLSTSTLGSMTPKDDGPSYLWAAAYIVVGVPLNAAVFTSVIDVYVSQLERREARRQLREAPGRGTFLAMAHETSHLGSYVGSPHLHRSSSADGRLSGTKVPWGAFLEHRLRNMQGTVLHPKLIDGLKATFDALDRDGDGWIEWQDIQADAVALGTGPALTALAEEPVLDPESPPSDSASEQ